MRDVKNIYDIIYFSRKEGHILPKKNMKEQVKNF